MSERPVVSIEELLEHRDFLGSLAARLASDEASAEDLVQEVWVKALKSPPPTSDNLRRWLARVLENQAVSNHRTRESRRRRESESARDEAAEDNAGTEAAREDLRRFLAEAVLSLPEPERAVVILRFYSGLGGEEAARRLGVSPRTVRLRMASAVERLRLRVGDGFASDAESGP